MQFSDIKCDVCQEGLVSCILSEVALMKAFLFDTTMPSYCKNQFSTPNSQTHTHTYTTVTPSPKKTVDPTANYDASSEPVTKTRTFTQQPKR